jgi:hypothetical protein
MSVAHSSVRFGTVGVTIRCHSKDYDAGRKPQRVRGYLKQLRAMEGEGGGEGGGGGDDEVR